MELDRIGSSKHVEVLLPSEVPKGDRPRPYGFFDLDGTLREPEQGRFIGGPEDVVIKDGVAPVLRALSEAGCVLVAVTNQGGVACGYKTAMTVVEELQATSDLLHRKLAGDPFDLYLASLTHPGGNESGLSLESVYRKPRPGMLMRAIQMMEPYGPRPDLRQSFMVGDRMEDYACAVSAGVSFSWSWTFFGRPVPEGVSDWRVKGRRMEAMKLLSGQAEPVSMEQVFDGVAASTGSSIDLFDE